MNLRRLIDRRCNNPLLITGISLPPSLPSSSSSLWRKYGPWWPTLFPFSSRAARSFVRILEGEGGREGGREGRREGGRDFMLILLVADAVYSPKPGGTLVGTHS